MKRLVLACLAFYFVSILAAQTSQSPVERKEVGNLVIEGIPEIPPATKERMNQYQNVRHSFLVDWDPSGSGLLMATRFGEAYQLHYVASPGADRQQITFYKEPVDSAWYCPDPKQPGFLFSMDTGGGEFYQIYWFDVSTGQRTLLTDGLESVNENPLWSNSGKQFVFSSTKRNQKDFDLYLMDAVEPKSTRLLKQTEGYWAAVDWSADDSLVLLFNYIAADDSKLYVINTKTREMTQINPTDTKISYGSVAFSRERNGVYYTSDEDSEFIRLTYYDLGTEKKELLTPDLKWDVSDLVVSKDGQWIAYATNEGGVSKIYLAATSKLASPEMIPLPKGVASTLQFDFKDRRLGFSLNTSQSPTDIYSVDLETKKLNRWTSSEVGGLNRSRFVTPDLIVYATFDDKKIPSFYFKPAAGSKKKVPVVIDIHGGPESQTDASFSSFVQYLVNELGIAVLQPNVRGSTGYGKSYQKLDNGYNREDSVKDIGKLLDWIAQQPELDASRVAVFGGSYGGYMVLSSMFHYNDRLRCGIDVVGISNFVTFLNNTEDYRRDLRRVEYGDEQDPAMRKFLESISPTNNADKIAKPLFVVQGQNDPRVPVTEAEQIVKVVREKSGTVWYLMAKDEGHGFAKKSNRDFYLNASSLFFEEYLLK